MSRRVSSPDAYEDLVKKTLNRHIPFKVDWEITYRCNLNCIHCYQTGPRSEPELSTKEIFSILNQLAESGCLYITFTGGEALLRDDFFEIAGYARQKEFAIRIFTNGTLIDDGVADRINVLNPLTVEISLYATEPCLHEQMTGVSGSFKKTVQAFHLLKERSINTVLKCTFTQHNIKEFDRLKEFSREIGSEFVFSFTVIPKIDGSQEVTRLRLKEAQLKDLFASHKELVSGIEAGGVNSYQPLCAAGFNSLYISPYGEVFPCVVLRECCGNLRDTPLKDIWNAPFFKKIREVEFKDLKSCFGCDFSYYCDRCAGLAWLEANDLFGPSPNDCLLARVRRDALERKDKSYGKEKEAVLQ